MYFHNTAIEVLQNTNVLNKYQVLSAFFNRLFSKGNNAFIISQITEELEIKHKGWGHVFFRQIEMLVQANRFLFNPKKEKLDTLHPDVRTLLLSYGRK